MFIEAFGIIKRSFITDGTFIQCVICDGGVLVGMYEWFNKLFNFLSTVKAQQEAQAETEGGKEAPQETAGEQYGRIIKTRWLIW